ncbi:putative membrane protein [Rhodoligotrophos appendicifer]|uniref:TPM domain-containing protein n=1 Tax=Rhodoligotrophos appendicifer TaxID=987056 RepID=UPI001FECB111|nr:TPM domain-containing protein [Rhodoligotrophos appendicifer]
MARINAAITAAEKRTSGEIVIVLAHQSDDYVHVPILWASLIALVAPLPLIYLTTLGLVDIYTLQLATFLVLALLFELSFIRPHLIPRRLQALRAHQRAAEQFLARNLHTTSGRTGVLLFISLTERHAEVLADEGISSKVAVGTWQEIVRRLTIRIGSGNLADAITAAIDECGTVLAASFPPEAGDRDELPNHLIVL